MEVKNKKPSLTWVWITATAFFCVLFAFALIPGVAAQGSSQPSQGSSLSQSQVRNYTNIMQNVFDFILRGYIDEVDPQILFEGAMNGMFGALEDPYSSFLTESDMKDMGDTTQGSFGGVGLNITQSVGARPDGKPRYVEVVSPIENTPGWRAGISPGDFIVEIDGVMTDTLSMDEVLSRLRGTPGEEVRLVIRRGERIEFPVTIVRAVIEVPTVRHAMIGDTGYLKLTTFTPFTADRAIEAINEFQANNYKSLILDLRNNYGGRLDSAVQISNLFLDGGLVVRIRSRIRSENRDFNANRQTLVSADIPVIVLINRGSASASEIVAGALKDRGRAYLVGENTFGKGSVQQVFPLSDVGFKITTGRYFTPSDANIDKVGIPPDREISFPEVTEEDAERLNELINANRIPVFAAANPEATAAQIDAFARTLERDYRLNLPLLRRLIRNELNRTSFAPVYDLEYDIQLQEAMNILRSGQYQNLMQNARTLRALQEEEEESELALAS
ncbi:MAG: S41 family peptidase [Treponema sp.]|nr:S41 family peptidase [Treponema sp.]